MPTIRDQDRGACFEQGPDDRIAKCAGPPVTTASLPLNVIAAYRQTNSETPITLIGVILAWPN